MAQGFFPFVYVLGSLLLMLPTGIVALVMLLTGAEGGIWLAIIPVALANGIGILALGTWLGGKLMDARNAFDCGSTRLVRLIAEMIALA